MEMECMPLDKEIVDGYHNLIISVNIFQLETSPRIALYSTETVDDINKINEWMKSIKLNTNVTCWVPEKTLEFSKENIDDKEFIEHNSDRLIYIKYNKEKEQHGYKLNIIIRWILGGLISLGFIGLILCKIFRETSQYNHHTQF